MCLRFSGVVDLMNSPSDQSNRCEPGLVRWRANATTACQSAVESGSLIFLFQMLGRLDEELSCTNGRLARIILFSDQTIADFINATFEPIWESVRPVPIISIDFRNGHVINRTIPGNIATYVLAADGQVLDILPGLYTPDAYLSQLKWLKTLDYIASMPVERRQAALYEYHTDAIKRLTLKKSASVSQSSALSAHSMGTSAYATATERSTKPIASTKPDLPEVAPGVQKLTIDEASQWQAQVQDTRDNEVLRRCTIHEALAKSKPVRPDAVTKWLFREVLNLDLDDPYLGLASP